MSPMGTWWTRGHVTKRGVLWEDMVDTFTKRGVLWEDMVDTLSRNKERSPMGRHGGHVSRNKERSPMGRHGGHVRAVVHMC